MDSIASSREEADNQLRKLQEERGGDGNEFTQTRFDRMLSMISDDLYQKPTHFILELIQNADDNCYADSVVPSLHLALYGEGAQAHFRTTCNEVGFTHRQLSALADIGGSTKKFTASGRKGYIGEKGIGFKSVFKVADVVHVASGFYEFKLDRNKPMGMVCPILSDFPVADRETPHTQFLLLLKHKNDAKAIQSDLQELEPQLLMFLRNLQEIRVSVHGTSRIYRSSYSQQRSWGGEVVTITESNDDTGPGTESDSDCGGGEDDRGVVRVKYVVQRHVVQDMPGDDRRGGVTASDVVVAFAVKNKLSPSIAAQKVFAFLPIADFGFPFLIHADFLLVASREGLDYTCPWNIALRDGICDAVVAAFKRFAALDEVRDGQGLCYSWPKYLALPTRNVEFWDTIRKCVLTALKSTKILKSRNDQLQEPTALRYVPKAHRLADGTLFSLPSVLDKHLSFSYDNVRSELSLIGVSQQSRSELCQEFIEWASSVGTAGVSRQDANWHEKIASLFDGQRGLLPRLQKLPIVPLRDGSWVTALAGHLYLVSEDGEQHVPSGIRLSLVDGEASRNPVRRAFFKFLGIEAYSTSHVRDLILELHEQLNNRSTRRLLDDLVSDAVFLFEHREELNYFAAPDIFFATTRNGQVTRTRSPSRIYLNDLTTETNLIMKYRNTAGSPFATLSDLYDNVLGRSDSKGSQRKFREWLLRSQKECFATTPILVHDLKLTTEWRFLMDQDVMDLLHALRMHPSDVFHPTPGVLRKAVPELEVGCLDGVKRPLGLLAVPTQSLRQVCPHIDYAALPDASRFNWNFLSEYGVVTSVGTTACLRELQALRRLCPVGEVSAKAVHEIYKTLNARASSDGKEIKHAFRTEPLVFVAKPKPMWCRHDDCVWTAQEPLKNVIRLKSHYGDCRELFREVLGVRKATIEHVVNELCALSDQDNEPAQRFEVLITLLDRLYCDGDELDDEQILGIRSASIFPVLEKRKQNSGEQGAGIVLRSANGGNDWYIPDRAILESAFRYNVDMLSLPVKLVRETRAIFVRLGCESRFLSSAVKETTEAIGATSRDERQENYLKTRLGYVAQLTGDEEDLMQVVSELRVWSVSSVQTTRRLPDAVDISDDKQTGIELSDSTNIINIYVRKDAEQNDVRTAVLSYFLKEHGIEGEDAHLAYQIMLVSNDQLPKIIEEHDLDLLDKSDSTTPGEEDTGGSADEVSDTDGNDVANDTDDNPEIGTNDNVNDDGSIDANANANDDADDDTHDDTHDDISDDTSDDAYGRSHESRGNDGNVTLADQPEELPNHDSSAEEDEEEPASYFPSTPTRRRTTPPALTPSPSHRRMPPIRHYHGEGTSRPSLPIRNISAGTESTASPSISSRSQSSPFSERPSSPLSPPTPFSGFSSPGFSETMFCDQQTRTAYRTEARNSDNQKRKIGRLGEDFINAWLARRIADWDPEQHWTSRLRGDVYTRFTEREKYFADFTYLDHSGHMRDVLQQAGVDLDPSWSSTTVFHLEVKSTLGHADDVFYVSRNQVEKMRRHDGDPDNAYVLLRVFDLQAGPATGIQFFSNPWRLSLDGVLDFRAEAGYRVYVCGGEETDCA